MYSVFLSSYRNTRESLGELEKAVETRSHSISRSPKLLLVLNTVHVFYFLITIHVPIHNVSTAKIRAVVVMVCCNH